MVDMILCRYACVHRKTPNQPDGHCRRCAKWRGADHTKVLKLMWNDIATVQSCTGLSPPHGGCCCCCGCGCGCGCCCGCGCGCGCGCCCCCCCCCLLVICLIMLDYILMCLIFGSFWGCCWMSFVVKLRKLGRYTRKRMSVIGWELLKLLMGIWSNWCCFTHSNLFIVSQGHSKKYEINIYQRLSNMDWTYWTSTSSSCIFPNCWYIWLCFIWKMPHKKAHITHHINHIIFPFVNLVARSVPEEYKPLIFSEGTPIPFPPPTRRLKAPTTRWGRMGEIRDSVVRWTAWNSSNLGLSEWTTKSLSH